MKATRCRTRKAPVDPIRDFEDVETELILSDLVVVEKAAWSGSIKIARKTKNPEADKEFALLERIKGELEADRAIRTFWSLSEEDEEAHSRASSFFRRSRCCA